MDVVSMLTVFPGTLCICDKCNKHTTTGYYICVLNAIYCPECYEGFIGRAINYEEDHEYEKTRYQQIMADLHKNEIAVKVIDHE